MRVLFLPPENPCDPDAPAPAPIIVEEVKRTVVVWAEDDMINLHKYKLVIRAQLAASMNILKGHEAAREAAIAVVRGRGWPVKVITRPSK